MERRLFYTVIFLFGLLIPHLDWRAFLFGLGASFLFALWRPPLRCLWVMGLAILMLGVGYGRSRWDIASERVPKLEKSAEVQGVILESPRQWGRSVVFFFRVESLQHVPVEPFKILVRWSGCEEDLEVGDRWALQGIFVAGEDSPYPGGFSQKRWLWSQRATAVLVSQKFHRHHYLGPPTGYSLHQLSYRARAWMMRRLSHIRHEQARALVAGVVFGETQSLPKELQEQFRRTGTSHLLAASGMNVALLAGLILMLGRGLGMGAWRVAPLAIPAVIGYAFLAGCAPSITRAAAGTTLALIALWIGRTSNAWNTLSLSVWALLLWDPRQVFDLGFQLSVVAVVGLVCGPKAPKRVGFVGSSLILTFSASLATLPIFWWTFGELSSTLLLANLILGPVVELLFPLGLLLTLAPLPPLVWLCESLARLSLWLVGVLSELSDPILLVRPDFVEWILVFSAIWCWLRSERWRTRSLALPLVCLAVALNVQSARQPSCPMGELIVRRAGPGKPIYWISTHSREVLVITEAWQEGRGRQMVRQLGCLKEPEIRVLEGAPLRFKWGRFDWERVAPSLPGCRFLEVRVRGEEYFLKTGGVFHENFKVLS